MMIMKQESHCNISTTKGMGTAAMKTGGRGHA
jgi:hypothetical protein